VDIEYASVLGDADSVAMMLILGHEWGHMLQFDLGLVGPSERLELQADSAAGAFLASESLGLSIDAVTARAEAALDAWSPEGVLRSNSTTDRLRAVLDGYTNGWDACLGYERR